jgi:hypothetical protein
MTTFELQEKLKALKASAYDTLAQIEFHQTNLKRTNDEINSTNNELIQSIVKDKENGNSNQIKSE